MTMIIKKEFRNFSQAKAGFTLVETLLAVALLSMAIIAPLSIASSGMAATTGKDRLIAIVLARDAIEYVRNIRDKNRLTGSDWMTGLDACRSPNQCLTDSLNTNGQGAPIVRGGEVLRFDSTTGLYGFSNGGSYSNSQFTRYLTITDLVAGREVRLTATVQWTTPFSIKSVTAVEQLTNW